MERDYGPLTIEQAAFNVASHLGLLMLAVHETPPFGSIDRDEALRIRAYAENDLARSLADYADAIVRAVRAPSPGTSGGKETT